MKYVEMLESVGRKIVVHDSGIKITEDALLLSEYVKKILNSRDKAIQKGRGTSRRLMEIGAGQGIVSIMLSGMMHIDSICAVEIQKDIYLHLLENITMNSLSNRIEALNMDIADVEGEFDYIISNPPYRKADSGRLPKEEAERISKYEICLTLKELFWNIRRLLKNNGEFFVIVPDERLNDAFSYIYSNNMDVQGMEINRYVKRSLVVIHGKKGGKANSGIRIEVNS